MLIPACGKDSVEEAESRQPEELVKLTMEFFQNIAARQQQAGQSA
jgi:hypothetical protein